ncbi:MAG: hypothetical protein Q4D76_18980 [Oscillospiraceae bacterium]|nr:hypothetical protein [Oscillospiraceae bacterium]
MDNFNHRIKVMLSGKKTEGVERTPSVLIQIIYLFFFLLDIYAAANAIHPAIVTGTIPFTPVLGELF